CGGEGHISKDCSNPTTPKSRYNCVDCTSSVGAKQAQQLYSGGRSGRGFSARNCYTCGGVGHLSRDCVGDQKCFNCGEVGHVSRDCSRPQAKNCYSVSIIKIFYISFKDKNSPHFLIFFCWISSVIQCGQSGHISKDWSIPVFLHFGGPNEAVRSSSTNSRRGESHCK
ncbi:hypothetical protein PSHT_05755, partial [Puccinia striiformis]